MTATKLFSSCCAVIVLCLLAWTPTLPAQQDLRPGTPGSNSGHAVATTHAGDVAAHQVYHYGVLGAVEHPNVYVSRDANLSVSRLVEVAGGFAAAPHQFAQIIRCGQNGLRIHHSASTTDHLMPGDIVVFSAEEQLPRQAGFVGVAFVGIFDDAPIVVSFPRQVATVPDVLAAMNQSATLIDSVRVVRTSRTHPRLPAGELPSELVEGDVLVFDPAQIDRTALASAQSFPPPVLIAESFARESSQQITIRGLPSDGQSDAEIEAPALEELPEPPERIGPAVSRLPETSPQPLAAPTIVEVAGTTDDLLPAPSGPPNEGDAEDLPDSEIVPTGLIEAPRPDETLASEVLQPESAPTSQPKLSPPLMNDPPPPAEFAADSFDRLAMAPIETDATTTSTSPAVPEPVDPSQGEMSRGFSSRTTTLGLIVLLTAAACFAGSLWWSRLDKSMESHSESGDAQRDVDRSVTLTARRRVLDRLIENSLPLIEEAAVLPEQVAYHGEAVGRRRLRIDSQHDLHGPHPGGASRQAARAVAGRAATSHSKSQPPLADDSDRPGERGQQDTSKPRDASTGGLLERVLLAMEREKRR